MVFKKSLLSINRKQLDFLTKLVIVLKLEKIFDVSTFFFEI